MYYKWKIPGLLPVDAQTAGDELQRIYRRNGTLNAEIIVSESMANDAPLHPCFEWDDQKAAKKYRENQAENIVRAIVTVNDEHPEIGEVRVFQHVKGAYHPMEVIVESADMAKELLASALKELESFKIRYSSIETELSGVFLAIERLTA